LFFKLNSSSIWGTKCGFYSLGEKWEFNFNKIFSLKELGFKLITMRVSSLERNHHHCTTIGDPQWKYWNFKLNNDGLQRESGDLKRKYGSLQRESGDLKRNNGGLQRKCESLQRNFGVSKETGGLQWNMRVSNENLGSPTRRPWGLK